MLKKLSLLVAVFMMATVVAACATPASSLVVAPEEIQAGEPAIPAIPVLPHTNPLTGAKNRETYQEGSRPLAVMVDNVRLALPQTGISQADVTYEMVTEGGITRLMCVYSDYKTMPKVGPVRSARDQHIQLMIPMAALYMHIGGSTYATKMLEDFGWQEKDIDGKKSAAMSLQFDQERFDERGNSEQCWYTSGEMISSTIQNLEKDSSMPQESVRGPIFHFVPYDQPARILSGGEAPQAYLRFSGYTNAQFIYDEETGQYRKNAFGEAQLDAGTGEQVAYDNVLVLFTEIKKYPDGVLAKVDFSINGIGYYLNGGRYERVRWMKGSPQAPLRIVSGDGSEQDIQINCGNSYVAFIDFTEYDYFKIEGAADTNEAKEDPGEMQPGEDVEAKD